MFFTYLGRELRRRARQALVIALGLALGIGLAITVSSASDGVKAAQTDVLKSLYGVGTDITVTQPATRGSGGAQSFGFSGQAQTTTGTKTTTASQDTARVAMGSGTLATTTLTKVKALSGVSDAVGSLSLTDFNVSGKLTQSFTQAPSTTGSTGSTGRSDRSGSGYGGGSGGGFRAGGPSGNFSFNQTTMQGVDVSDMTIGPMSSVTLASGRELSAADSSAAVAVVNSSYATQQNIKVGATETLGGTKFTVVGIVTTSSDEDYFLPLAEAQKISSETGKVTTVYVKAASSTQISAVASEIGKTASGATVSTSAQLADSVSGSLSSTASLLTNLGRWLVIGVLAAAFLIAALLTMSAVGRRTREFGTLKAIGWTSRRVVRQVLGESIVTGLIGGVLGIGLGFAGALVIDKVAPQLTAAASTSSASTTTGGFGGGGGASRFRKPANDITVHLTAPVHLNILLIAVALAVLGGLIAGALGGWRASSLRPADALSKVA
ncbi:ABC transporter permease [Actinospica durhamensis]|uniref:ABC transporter permease n=1 Tax=Actinospica durhamensis TaxID=1508375 RepID=A0A941IRC2_9ACTN|nr:FtsX-like permease family protein [Actinospica durhamensis]MBR7833788.1 ABC transporter permease [Actinospica durhamensis]